MFFSTGRNQADVFVTKMNMLVIVVGIKYSVAVSSAVRELVVKPTMMKIPDKPELSKLIADGELTSSDKVVPDNMMDLYKEEMKMFAREKKQFELDCRSVYLLVKEQYSPNMISELKEIDEFDVIKKSFHLINLLKLIKKICYNYKMQEDTVYALVTAAGTLYHTKQRKDETTDDFAMSTENRLQPLAVLLTFCWHFYL